MGAFWLLATRRPKAQEPENAAPSVSEFSGAAFRGLLWRSEPRYNGDWAAPTECSQPVPPTSLFPFRCFMLKLLNGPLFVVTAAEC